MISVYKILVIAALTIFTGCSTDYSIPTEKDTSVKPKDADNLPEAYNLSTFKVNGELVNTTVWTISRFVTNSNLTNILLNITTDMHDDKRAINVNLGGSVPGIYPVAKFLSFNKSDNSAYGAYYPDYTGAPQNKYSFTSGAFNLTEVDTAYQRVNGSFYGSVKSSKEDSLEITEGKIINGFLKVDFTSY